VTIAPLKLYLVRHGQTAWSLSGQHNGRTDIPLTADGEEEARELVPWLAQVQFARIFASLRQRAQLTCELSGLSERMEIEPDLAEWDYGDYEGKLSADIRVGRPNWNIFQDGCPNGEMPENVSARADRLIARLGLIEGNIALFSHGQFGMALVARWIGLPVLQGQHFLLNTASLNILGQNPAHPKVRVIALWNAVPASLGRGR
jgi:broad specificity phosphatase PhoE